MLFFQKVWSDLVITSVVLKNRIPVCRKCKAVLADTGPRTAAVKDYIYSQHALDPQCLIDAAHAQ